MDGESELALSSKAEETVDKKVTQHQLNGSGVDISKPRKCRLRRSANYAVGQPTKTGNTTNLPSPEKVPSQRPHISSSPWGKMRKKREVRKGREKRQRK